ncbi:MAG TPA: hypothetical protein PLZ77_09960 [Lachnospiraceae bacterium]|nr:hypothetical protein [Lachnospiraceae bacterium]HPF30410.1 hypothetical protein [Lachnospiraceae bacterium]
MENNYTSEEIKTLLDALTTGEIDDVGLKSAPATTVMRQQDIDLLVNLIMQLQVYQKIGTPEECQMYKKKALGE